MKWEARDANVSFHWEGFPRVPLRRSPPPHLGWAHLKRNLGRAAQATHRRCCSSRLGSAKTKLGRGGPDPPGGQWRLGEGLSTRLQQGCIPSIWEKQRRLWTPQVIPLACPFKYSALPGSSHTATESSVPPKAPKAAVHLFSALGTVPIATHISTSKN